MASVITEAEVLKIFKDYDILIHKESGCIVCSKCKTAIGKESKTAFEKHFSSEPHELETLKFEELKLAFDGLNSLLGEPHPNRMKYFEGAPENITLPIIPYLEVVDCRVCSFIGKEGEMCKKIVKDPETFRWHVRTVHDISKKDIESIRKQSRLIKCQTINSNRRWVRWFPVCDETESDSGTIVPTTPLSRKLRNSFETEGTRKTNFIFGRTDREKSLFVSLSETEEKLNDYGLTLTDIEKIAYCSVLPESDLYYCLFKVVPGLELLFAEAKELACNRNRFRSFRKDIATPGVGDVKKHFRFCTDDEVGRKTMKRYAYHSKIVIKVAYQLCFNENVRKKFQLSEKMSSSIRKYARYCIHRGTNLDEADPKFLGNLHNILLEAYFEPAKITTDKKDLFCEIIALCISCSTNEPPGRPIAAVYSNECEKEKVRVISFNSARGTGAILSGIMYSVSCTAILEILKYSTPSNFPEKYGSICECLRPRAPVGLSVLVELRSLCSTIRPSELRLTRFVPCPNPSHGLCGTTEGYHLSAIDVGKSVHALHALIRKKIFVDIFKRRSVFEGFEESLASLFDDVDNLNPGYNATFDPRNADFMKRVLNWVTQFCDQEVEYVSSQKFLSDAYDALKMIITAIHLTGGAPGRGTEVASYLVTNTESCRRSIYLIHDELLIVPQFDKRRGILGSDPIVVTRHTDKETANLYKSFFILLRSICVELLRAESKTEKGKENIRDCLTMELIEPGNMSRVISKVLNQIGIEMKFSTWRHHHTGLVKEKCRKENRSSLFGLLRSQRNDDDSEDEDSGLEGLDQLQKAAIEQGSHSVRTAQNAYAQNFGYNRMQFVSSYFDRVELNRMASREWHRECQITSYESSEETEKKKTRNTDAKQSTAIERLSDDLKSVQKSIASIAAENRRILQIAERYEKKSRRETEYEDPIGPPIDPKTPNTVKRINLHCGTPNSLEEYEEDFKEENLNAIVVVTKDTLGTCNLLSENKLIQPRPRDYDAVSNGYTAIDAVQRLYGVDSHVRNKSQITAMNAVARNDCDVLVCLATGAGKTAVVMGPLLYERGVTVWLTPLKALRIETESRLLTYGMSVFTVQTGVDISVVKNRMGNVLIVSPEAVVLDKYRAILKDLTTNDVLNRVVIDEAHLIPMSRGFRQPMFTVSSSSENGTLSNVVMMTATAPECLVDSILESCGTIRKGLQIIRGDPFRPNLKLCVSKLENGADCTLDNAVVAYLCQFLTEEGRSKGRIIVYCITVADVERICEVVREEKLNGILSRFSFTVGKYHGKIGVSGSTELNHWNRKSKDEDVVMVCTNAFGCGIDSSDVRAVLIAGGSRSLVEFWQQAGRAGRDGRKSEVTVLYDADYLRKAGKALGTKSELGNFKHWAEDVSSCRRLEIEDFLGGAPSGKLTCVQRVEKDPNTLACDNCERNRLGQLLYRRRKDSGRKIDARSGSCSVSNLLTLSNGNRSDVRGPYTSPRNQRRSLERDVASAEQLDSCKRIRPASLAPMYNEVVDGKRMKILRKLESTGKIEWLRSVAGRLKEKCVECIVRFMTDPKIDTFHENVFRGKTRYASNCNYACMPFHIKKNRCFRCEQAEENSRHISSQCPYFQPVYSRQTYYSQAFSQCGECRMNSIGSESVHRGDYGKGCVLKWATKLCLVAYRNRNSRDVICSEGSPYFKATQSGGLVFVEGEREGLGSYIRWLTKNREEGTAGLSEMVSFIVERYKLHRFGIC